MQILKTIGSLWVIYFVLRVFFLAWNWGDFAEAELNQVITSFLTGMRFDIVAICYLNAIWIIALHVPMFRWEQFKLRLLKWCFFLSNAALIALNVSDIDMINFTGRRSTIDFLDVLPEAQGKVSAILVSHAALIILAILSFRTLWRGYHIDRRPTLWGLPVFIVAFGIGARGGIQPKPLGVVNATAFGTEHLNALAYNSTYSFLASYAQRRLQPVNYFDSWREVQRALPPRTGQTGRVDGRGQNVVIIILESFASEFVGFMNDYPGYTPELDKIAEQGVFFRNAFANGRRSMDAMPSILAGIPSMTNESYITSNYKMQKEPRVGDVLKTNNYISAFFHGGHNGTMFFDSFAHSLGVDQYHGFNEMEGAENYTDGSWGVFDEPFFRYMIETISQWRRPFVSTFFSLSSHHPYPIPESHRGRFPKGTLDIHESIGYSDWALGEFFRKAKKQPWYSDTLFIITADHTTKSDRPEYRDRLAPFRIPMVLFHPGKDLKGQLNLNKVVQQTDILPTVYDFLRISKASQLPFGESLFVDSPGMAIMNTSNRFWYVNGSDVVELHGGKHKYFELGSLEKGAAFGQKKKARLLSELHAFIQFYRNGLLHGRL